MKKIIKLSVAGGAKVCAFTLIECVPMRRMFLIDREESIPPIVQFGRIA